MDLSILIVNWNTRGILKDCLSSIYDALRGLDAEVIVVDNASSDRSAEMVQEEFPLAKLIRNTENRGFAAANNQAMSIAQGRYVLLLNSDTVILGNVLERTVAYMDQQPEVGVMGCRVLNPDKTVQLTCFQYPSLVNLLLLLSGLSHLGRPRFLGRHQIRHWRRDSERDVDVVTGCYMVVRREAIAQVGRLDESFFFCGEETDWCLRFQRTGWKIRFAPVGDITHIGNASGRHYSFRRDLMLSQGLVRLHRKHSGLCAATAAWTVLFMFNITRAVVWSVVSIAKRTQAVRQRRDHFVGIAMHFHEAWPTAGPTT